MSGTEPMSDEVRKLAEVVHDYYCTPDCRTIPHKGKPLSLPLVDQIQAFADSIAAAERERCARAVCPWCERVGRKDIHGLVFLPAVLADLGRYVHGWEGRPDLGHQTCQASAIRKLGSE